MAKQIINVAMPRSATKSIAWFLKNLGVESYHERVPKYILFEHQIDINQPVKKQAEYANKIKELHSIKEDKNYFDSDWAKGLVMAELQKAIPNLDFTICIRNPNDNANSLRYCRSTSAHKDNPEIYKYDINWYGECYLKYYTIVLEQIKKMKRLPYVYMFSDYVGALTNEHWLRAFGLYNQENMEKMQIYILGRKVNSRGDYARKYNFLSSGLYNECLKITNQIFMTCRKIYELKQ